MAASRARAAYRSREARPVAVVAVGAAALGGLLWCLRAYNGWADLVVLLPPAALGIGALAGVLRDGCPPATGTLAVAGTSALFLVAGMVSSLTNYEQALDHQRAEVDAMFAAAPPDATIVSIGAPQPLMLTQRRNPFRHQMFLTGLDEYVDDTYPGGLDGFVRVLRRLQPTLIVVDHPNWYYWLKPTLAGEYIPVGQTIGDFTWYAHHSVGPEVIADLQAADRTVMPSPVRTPGREWRRVDPLGPLLGVAAFLVFALYGFQGYLSRDSGSVRLQRPAGGGGRAAVRERAEPGGSARPPGALAGRRPCPTGRDRGAHRHAGGDRTPLGRGRVGALRPRARPARVPAHRGGHGVPPPRALRCRGHGRVRATGQAASCSRSSSGRCSPWSVAPGWPPACSSRSRR